MTLEKKTFILKQIPEKMMIRGLDHTDDEWSKPTHVAWIDSSIEPAATTLCSQEQGFMVIDCYICGLFLVCASWIFVAP